MRAMKLADVEAKTGRKMEYAEAITRANAGDPFLQNMTVALSLHTWQNSGDDWLRLQAALVILAYKRTAK